ncbi:MAG: PhoH family protein [Polyangiales bacterium]
MRKIYVLDTNVLLHDPHALYKFEDNIVVIPIFVIEEIDQFKKELSELGQNARHIARLLDELRESNGESLQVGVPLADTGGTLMVVAPHDRDFRPGHEHGAMDQAILRIALQVQGDNNNTLVVFVTMDTNLRIRADALGLRAENYEGGRVAIDDLYSGVLKVETDTETVDRLAKREPIELSSVPIEGAFPNAGVVLRDRHQPRHTALGRVDAACAQINPLRVGREGVWRVRPRNLEQYFALDSLLDPNVHLVTLVGKAGTGKTLLAIAAGLQAVVHDSTHSRLLVSRPIFPLGRDVGYLPGTVEEKLNPWMQPIFDNLEYIFSSGRQRTPEVRSYEELLSSGAIQIEPLTYIRGRSLAHQFLIVDEAQNLTPHQVKTVITRCGVDTKIILTGDPYQIDNPYVDSASNGLTIAAQRFQGEPIAAHVTLVKGERSELAERATQLL